MLGSTSTSIHLSTPKHMHPAAACLVVHTQCQHCQCTVCTAASTPPWYAILRFQTPKKKPRSIRRLMSPFSKGETRLGSCVLCTQGYDE
jgi:hypothetical protein